MVKSEDVPVVLSGNEARGGVTEHRVHYVLAFGLAGSVIAFVAIGLYFGYDRLTQTISQTSIRSDPTTLVSYAIPIALAASRDSASAWPVEHDVGWPAEHQPDADALAGRAAILRAWRRYGRPLFVG